MVAEQNTQSSLSVVQPAPVAIVDDWSQERIEFIRKNFCGGAPDAIADVFLQLCRRRRLAPEEKHVYLVNRGTKDYPNWVMQTGIDGYRLIADRTRQYAGSDEPEFVTSGAVIEWTDKYKNVQRRERPDKATVTIYKIVDGNRYPFTASARWDEYNGGRNLWQTMPFLMLSKCAEALALRKAFPAELSGIYTDTEMDQAEVRGPEQQPGEQSQQRRSGPKAATDELTDWTAFWSKARAKKIDKDVFTDLTGQPPQAFATPQAAWDALIAAEQKMTEGAAAEAAPSDVVEGQYVEVDHETGEIIGETDYEAMAAQ